MRIAGKVFAVLTMVFLVVTISTSCASFGVDPKQLSTISFGEERPLDLGHNEDVWAKSRRAHFILLK